MHKQQANTLSFVLAGGMVSLILGGCSSEMDRRIADNGFGYLEVTPTNKTLVVPKGLDTPVETTDYRIPPLANGRKNTPLGADVDVRSPAQVFPVVPGSKAETDGQNITLWFTARSVTQQIDNDIWNEVIGFLNRRGIAIQDTDVATRSLDTGWFYGDTQLNPWTEQSDKDDQIQVHQRYRFMIKSDKERHRTGLTAQLLSHEYGENGSDMPELTSFDHQRFAALMLNQVAMDYDKQLRAGVVSKESNRLQMTLGVDDNGLTAWLVDASFETTWDRVIALLPQLNFEINSKTQSKGLIEVDYDEPNSDFWKAKDLEPFGLDSGTYRLQFGEYKGKTSITLFDENKKPVPSSVVSKMFLGLSKAFSRQQTAVIKK